MDPRVRALLEPKAFAKSGKKSVRKKDEELSDHSPRSANSKKIRQSNLDDASQSISEDNNNQSSNSQLNPASHRSVPIYDPRKLLDPRGARKNTKSDKSNPYLASIDSQTAPQVNFSSSAPAPSSSHLQRENSGSRTMIEDLYGIERRREPPVKRQKLDTDQDDDKTKGKGRGRVYHSSGIMGEYMRPNTDDQNQTTDHKKIVDLTNVDDVDDSDDDLKVVKARNIANEQVVCYGCLVINVHAHAVPQPRKMISIYGETDKWPIIRCAAHRILSRNSIIEVKDPEGFIFGRIEPDYANIFTPMLDGLKKFRLELWLHPRKRKPNETPHQPCSQILISYVNIYGRRADVERVGRVLGQRNIWLKNPTMVERGFETVNPHADQLKTKVPQSRPSQRNNLYSEGRTVEEATEAVSRLFDHYSDSTRPLQETDAAPLIVTTLLPHQKQALTFMLEREQPRTYGTTDSENSSLWRKKHKNNGLVYYEETVTGITLSTEPDQVFGGLLADVMGLGKTIETLALIANTKEAAEQYGTQPLIRSDKSAEGLIAQSKATLIVAPVSTVKNWEDQINEHIEPGALSFYVYHGPHREKDPLKLAQYDIVISTYSTIATECSSKGLGISPIKAIRWFRIVLDEAHTIRESRASQSQAMYSLCAERRWCLTGTPIQNRLDDLGSLTRFLRLYPYDTIMRFNQYVRSPAQSGDENYLKSLRVFIDSFTLRRLKDRVDLPARRDMVERLVFSNIERELHEFFRARVSLQIEEMAEEKKQRSISQHHVLRAIMTLRLICDHGRELLKEEDLEAFKGNSQSDAIDVDADLKKPPTITPREAYETLALLAEAELDLCKQCDKKIGGDSPRVETENTEDMRGYMLPCYDLLCTDCFEYHKGVMDDKGDDQIMTCPVCQSDITAQYVAIPKSTAELLDWAPEQTLSETSEAYKKGTYTGPSTKVKALLDDLNEIREESKELVAKGEPPLKSVVFSEFTSNLDLIERGLDNDGYEGAHVRIDGSMSLSKRKAVIDSLNNDDSVTILLASIKAAGQGLNLTVASRAFIMEPMWNPAAELQAVDRIYRIGQRRNVVVKRYQMDGSIEGRIALLQKKKQDLADISMNKNPSLLTKKGARQQNMKEILSLFR